MFESCRAHLAMTFARFAALVVLFALVGDAAPAAQRVHGLVRTTQPSGLWGVMTGRALLRLATAPGGWHDATPPNLPGAIYDVHFLDRAHGWLISADCAAATGAMFRTTDGGRSWTRLPGRWTRNCSAGSTFFLDFADRQRGWLVAVDPHAADSSVIYATSDGGRRWRLVTRRRDQRSDGPVRFVSRTLGWRATTWFGWPRPGPLLRSGDGGRTWAGEPELPTNRRYATPELAGERVVTAAARAGRVAVYERVDGRWRRVSAVLVPRPHTDVQIRAPSSRVRWLATGARTNLSTLLVSLDGGRTWSRRRVPRGTREVAAVSSRQAWLTAAGRLFRTVDGGRSWSLVAR